MCTGNRCPRRVKDCFASYGQERGNHVSIYEGFCVEKPLPGHSDAAVTGANEGVFMLFSLEYCCFQWSGQTTLTLPAASLHGSTFQRPDRRSSDRATR